MAGLHGIFPESPPQITDGVTLKFPAKLWRIVNTCKTGAISWDSDGESIKIERKKFEDQYLRTGVLFKTANFQSFIRQLNIYGFRKIPTNGPKNHQDIVFVYKHDFFKRGHPDVLSEVVRNTAVRKTQRENEIREVEAKHGKLEDLAKHHVSRKQTTKTVDESHPLLKSPVDAEMKYGIAVDSARKARAKITTVYLNPRVNSCDMTHISPSHLHHQVTDLLTAINDDDDIPACKRQKRSEPITICRPFPNKEPLTKDKEQQAAYPLTIRPPVPNQILFVPNPCVNRLPTKNKNRDTSGTKNVTFDQFSQDSTNSQKSNSLMFPCPANEDNDLESVFGDTLDQTFETEPFVNNENGGKFFSLPENSNMDVFESDSFDTDNSFSSLGEEQGFLTPAYFDPDTGVVTLLLPTLNPEY